MDGYQALNAILLAVSFSINLWLLFENYTQRRRITLLKLELALGVRSLPKAYGGINVSHTPLVGPAVLTLLPITIQAGTSLNSGDVVVLTVI